MKGFTSITHAPVAKIETKNIRVEDLSIYREDCLLTKRAYPMPPCVTQKSDFYIQVYLNMLT